MKKYILILFIILLCGCENHFKDNSLINNDETIKKDDVMEEFTEKINITINNETFSLTLEDNKTTREFIKMLPLNITMNELNGNEKYYYFDNSLPSNPSKVNQIKSGDIMLYGNDCLVLFYDTFKTNYSYTKIGALDNSNNIKNIVGKGNVNVYISK